MDRPPNQFGGYVNEVREGGLSNAKITSESYETAANNCVLWVGFELIGLRYLVREGRDSSRCSG